MKWIVTVSIALSSGFSSVGMDFSEDMLQGIKGVGLEVAPMSMRSNRLDLDHSRLREYAYQRLDELQVEVLSSAELDKIPGRPFLEVGVHIARAQGPSHLYSVTWKLREMAMLEGPKDTKVSMALSTWERESIGVANRPEAILQTVDRMIRLFSEEYHKTNVKEQLDAAPLKPDKIY